MNDIDKFRNNFFEKVIKDEKDREADLLLTQKNCYHKYVVEHVYKTGYEQRTCSKCNHSALKHSRVWNTKKCSIQ